MTKTTDTPSGESDYLSVATVARVLGLSKMTVYRMCNDGTLAHIRTGRAGQTYRILRSSFEAHRTPAVPAEPVAIDGQMTVGF